MATLILSTTAHAKYPESFYQDKVAETLGGQVEVRTEYNTRIDILTEDRAIEVDFSHKWAEAIGQSLHYSTVTGKKATIVLVLKRRTWKRHLEILNKTIEANELPIDVITVDTDGNIITKE